MLKETGYPLNMCTVSWLQLTNAQTVGVIGKDDEVTCTLSRVTRGVAPHAKWRPADHTQSAGH